MAEPLPTFSLSPRAFNLIIKYLPYKDLLWLSTCSEAFYVLVKDAITIRSEYIDEDGNKVRRHTHMSVELSSLSKIKIGLDNVDSPTEFNFYRRRTSKRYDVIGEKLREINLYTDTTQRSIVCWKETGTEDSFGVATNSIEDVLEFVEHMAEMFNGAIQELSIAPELTHHLENIQSIKVLREASDVTITNGTVSHEAIRHVLKVYGRNAELTLNCSIDRNFTFDHLLACDDTGHGDCTSNYFIVFTAPNSKLTNADINSWLHQWMASTCRQEWHVELQKGNGQIQTEEQGIYNDPLNQETWDMVRITAGLRAFRLTHDEPGLGRYLRRASDRVSLNIIISGDKLTIHRENSLSYSDGHDDEDELDIADYLGDSDDDDDDDDDVEADNFDYLDNADDHDDDAHVDNFDYLDNSDDHDNFDDDGNAEIFL